MALLHPVNALVDRSYRFVWRLQTEEGDAIAVPVVDDDSLIMNRWQLIGGLPEFVYHGEHLAAMRRRLEWMERVQTQWCCAGR